MFDKILTKYPEAMVYVCTLQNFEVYGDERTFPDTNGLGLTINDYSDALIELANLFGISIIDLNKAGLNWYNRSIYCGDYSTVTQIGLHPNADGHERLANRAYHDLINM